MYLSKWSDFDRDIRRGFVAFDELRRQIDERFRDPSGPLAGLARGATAWPRATFYDTGSELVVYAAVPGLSEKDLDISATGNVLTVRGERKVQAPEGCTVHREERGSIRFARSFTLPCEVDLELTSARISDGMLTIRMAKPTEAQPRQISVTASR